MATPARLYLTERELHEIVAEALAVVRFYRRQDASSRTSVERIQEVVAILQTLGASHDMGAHGCILTTTADAISKAYLNEPAMKAA